MAGIPLWPVLIAAAAPLLAQGIAALSAASREKAERAARRREVVLEHQRSTYLDAYIFFVGIVERVRAEGARSPESEIVEMQRVRAALSLNAGPGVLELIPSVSGLYGAVHETLWDVLTMTQQAKSSGGGPTQAAEIRSEIARRLHTIETDVLIPLLAPLAVAMRRDLNNGV